MPIISVKMAKGRVAEKKRELMKGLVEVTARTLDVAPETVRVVVTEIDPEDWGVGYSTLAERSRA